MKRSENVGLMLVGGVAFAATFAGGMAYMSMQRPSYAAQACTPAPNGTQNCQPPARGFTTYFYPSHWSWGSGTSTGAKPAQQAALTGTSRPGATSVSASGTERSGFGSSAKASFRPSAGG
jgi:hypothetical protein